MSGYLAWRFTNQGTVAHAVHTDGTNRAVGAALCGRISTIWHYGSHFGTRLLCLTCRRRAGGSR